MRGCEGAGESHHAVYLVDGLPQRRGLEASSVHGAHYLVNVPASIEVVALYVRCGGRLLIDGKHGLHGRKAFILLSYRGDG